MPTKSLYSFYEKCQSFLCIISVLCGGNNCFSTKTTLLQCVKLQFSGEVGGVAALPSPGEKVD